MNPLRRRCSMSSFHTNCPLLSASLSGAGLS